MRYGLMKVVLCLDGAELSRKEAQALIQKVTQRFRVLARVYNQDRLAIVALGKNESELGQVFDQVCEFIEQQGYGRVEEQDAFSDDFEQVFVEN